MEDAQPQMAIGTPVVLTKAAPTENFAALQPAAGGLTAEEMAQPAPPQAMQIEAPEPAIVQQPAPLQQ
jgi:hypothetical protein